MSFELTILGSSAATPGYNRHHTAQYLKIFNQHILIDCGEGTQLRLRQYRLKPNRIQHIFISHLHGDHYFGLIGLISTLHLQGRTAPLNLFGPAGLKEIISIQLKYSDTQLKFPINFNEVPYGKQELVFENDFFSVYSIPLSHRINCSGYLFKEGQKKRKLIQDKIPDNFNFDHLKQIKAWQNVEIDGKVYKYEDYSLAPTPSKSYAYCSDTKYLEETAVYCKNANLLYHESTFMEKDAERAEFTYHSTAKQAAKVAQEAGAEQLLIGHFSIRYKDLDEMLAEAQSVFANTLLAIEGETFEV